MTQATGGLLDSILRLPGEFASIAAQSPEQALLLAFGALVLAVAGLTFAVLAAGGVVQALARAFPSGGQPPQGQ